MKIFDAEISHLSVVYIRRLLVESSDIDCVNDRIEKISGVASFFECTEDLGRCKNEIGEVENFVAEDRAEYGDFQTNIELANSVVEKLRNREICPDFVIEPTCGKGNFILAVIQQLPKVKFIIGIEIHKPYVWQCKWNILDYYLSNPTENKPSTRIYNQNVFNFDFNKLSQTIGNASLLVIGNPPWVTNSKLGVYDSLNLPTKSNFKKQKGIDAITGKGNFDIAEYITYSIFRSLGMKEGYLAFLIKNSVVKNIVYEQKKAKYPISNIVEENIDSKKEFNVSVDASLFSCKLNSTPEYICDVFDFYTDKYQKKFGWHTDKFLANIISNAIDIDGKCPFVWRQGIKHDCNKVMEFVQNNGKYTNKLQEIFELEEDLVYNLLKSSDLKGEVVSTARYKTIITQKKVGESTQYISRYPLTSKYLYEHKNHFDKRKSSIYKGKPDFSIFGVGDYSFKPYKIAISGMYKAFHFTLVLPDDNNKPVMLDDTCYLIGFDSLEDAVYYYILLNSEITQQFLSTISFPDAKRMINKEVLMRIDIFKLIEKVPESYIKNEFNRISESFNLNVEYMKSNHSCLANHNDCQLDLFQ